MLHYATIGQLALFNRNEADRLANSHERWAGTLMEVGSLFGLNSAIKKNAGRTDQWTDPLTDGKTKNLDFPLNANTLTG